MEKLSLGADLIAPPTFVPAPAPKQIPRFTADNRWRPEEINYFNGSSEKMTTFVFRFKDISIIKKPKIIQQNFIISFTDEIFGWYQKGLI